MLTQLFEVHRRCFLYLRVDRECSEAASMQVSQHSSLGLGVSVCKLPLSFVSAPLRCISHIQQQNNRKLLEVMAEVPLGGNTCHFCIVQKGSGPEPSG